MREARYAETKIDRQLSATHKRTQLAAAVAGHQAKR
jgi:hypothetical protein